MGFARGAGSHHPGGEPDDPPGRPRRVPPAQPHSRHVGYMDADQFVYVRGRLSERLRVAGEYWYPRDVEEVLMRHSAIREAALIGLPDADLGHRPVACVTLQEKAIDSDEVIRFAERELGRGLEYVSIRVVGEMPMTPTGKI